MRRKSRKVRKPRGRASPKAARPDPLDAMIDASVQALSLKIDDAWRPAIRAHLQVTLRLGAQVLEFKLPDEAEPAPVFEP